MGEWMQRFLEKFRELLKLKAADGDLSSDDLEQAMRQARAHVGGMASGEKRRVEREAGGARMNEWRLLSRLSLSEDGKTGQVQIFPAVGAYNHPRYGKLSITPEFLKRVKANFDGKVYQQELPLTIDLEHESKLSGSAGWIESVEIKGDGGMWATVGFNERGKALVDADSYRYFSPEFYDSWQDPATSKDYSDVLIGGALTNRPFFKGMAPVAMMTEGVFAFVEAAEEGNDMMGMMVDIMAKMKAVMQKMQKGEMPADDDMEEMSEMIGKMKPDKKVDCAEVMRDDLTEVDLSGADASNAGTGLANTNREGPIMGMSDEEAKSFAEMGASLKSLSERLASETEARKLAEADAKRAAERVEAIERIDRRRQFGEFVRENRHAFEGEADTCVDRLEKLATKLDAGEFEDYLSERRSLASRIKASEAFVQVGRAGPGNGTVASEFDAAKRKLMAEKSLSENDAVVAVAASDPALYERFDREFKNRIRRGGE